jgi:hypothetical protein
MYFGHVWLTYRPGYVWAFARKAVVRKSEVIAEKGGEHIFLPLGFGGANDCEPYHLSCNLSGSPRNDN